MVSVSDFLHSYAAVDSGLYSMDELLSWIDGANASAQVEIKPIPLSEIGFWFYDKEKGVVRNEKDAFFSVGAVRAVRDGVISEQPILLQPDIGYLGILVKRIKGILHFLMQVKIEPGNVNCVQLSPTLQATKSNYTRVHSGATPHYLEYFTNPDRERILYDRLQSEQGSRFLGKQNRNILLEVTEDVPPHANFRWMTLGQIKRMMRRDNLVNMDARSVLAGLPLPREEDKAEALFSSAEMARSFFAPADAEAERLLSYLSKLRKEERGKTEPIPLSELTGWKQNDFGIFPEGEAEFEVGYFDISIEGREVRHWQQPLVKARGSGTFGLLVQKAQGTLRFLIAARKEIGCAAVAEFGPSVQWEPTHRKEDDNPIDSFFREHLACEAEREIDVMLSEEGGRFYHEQNRNVVLCIEGEGPACPEGYFWVDYAVLNALLLHRRCLNIQLRSLMSLLRL